MLRWIRGLGVLVVVGIGTIAPPARAEPVCSTPQEFNDLAAQQGVVATTGTLTFTMSGLPLAGVEKHHIVLMSDADASNPNGNSCVGIDFKTWGDVAAPQDIGTVKEELFNTCCVAADCAACFADREGATACETWAGPRPSDVAFTGPDQSCDITIAVSPETFSYAVACAPGASFGFEEPNRYAFAIGDVEIGVEDVATITNAQFCYEAEMAPDPDPDPDPDPMVPMNVPVLEDVTASPTSPNAVYPDASDLVVSTGDGEIWLKFSLADVDGTIASARLWLHSSMVASADGSGGDVVLVDDDSWSEATLTWSNRPPVTGAVLGRMGEGGVVAGTWYSVDVGAAVAAPDVYSFAIVPNAADTNGAHFESKEASVANAAYLEIVVQPAAADTSGSEGDPPDPEATTGDDPTTGGDADASSGGVDSGIGGTGVGLDRGTTGCACRSESRPSGPGALVVIVLGSLPARRAVRTRSRRRRIVG